jgi:HD-like signal output (HDOD) protein
MIADLTTASSALTPEDIVRELKTLPSAPKVLPRLKRLLSDGNSSMHEIVGLVRLDPGIAARVLHVANSAYFSKGVRCVTVEEAVHRVGYDEVYELVSYAVAAQVLVRPLSAYELDADELWKMSVACALSAETIAERSDQDRDVAYTIGLLHCVGMVAIDEWSSRIGRQLSLPTAGFPREATSSERVQLGFTQAETGGALLHSWDFPPAMCEPVRHQYAPRATNGHAKMACLLYAAKWLRSMVCAKTAAARPGTPETMYLQPLGLSAQALASYAPEITGRLGEVITRLKVDDEDERRSVQKHVAA